MSRYQIWPAFRQNPGEPLTHEATAGRLPVAVCGLPDRRCARTEARERLLAETGKCTGEEWSA